MNGKNIGKIYLCIMAVMLVGCMSTTSKNSNTTKKSCSFSSFQRKNTIGYEFDESSRISFSASPKIDVFDPSDFDMKVSVKFTHSFGGASNKRPCTYGSGYYGLVPYISNNAINLNRITSIDNIKSMIDEKRAR